MAPPAALRLDYVSPLPPVRSGIADYSRDLLPHLAPLCELRLLLLPDQEVEAELTARYATAPLGTPHEGRVPLYQMGNNRYHLAVHAAAMTEPGVVVLHDLVLHHFLLDRTVGKGDAAAYRTELARDHGWIGETVARPVRFGGFSNAAQFALGARRTLARRQRGLIVHSAWAAAELRAEDPELAVRAVPMGIPLPPAADEATGLRFRERLGIPADAPLIGSFGFQTPIKRTETVIRALAAPGLERVHLLVAGELSPYVFYDREARAAGVAARVHLTGFLPYDELEAAIAAADLALNLRYPSAGETSASLLRVLAVGRPVIVSDYAQFAELPAEVAVRVAPGEGESGRLAAAMRELLAAGERLAGMRRAARRYVAAEHDPARAASLLRDAIADLAGRTPPGDRDVRVPPPTSLVWSRLPGRLEVAGATLPWAEGERRRLRIVLENRSPALWLAGERGPGGVVFELQLRTPEGDLLAGRPWPPLPGDLAPGEGAEIVVEVRRPPGPARLRIEPHVLGVAGFSALGGPVWEAEL
ncbi:MAG: glycosyltransferase [Acidobacteriota bacterium]|nr:glycosyltransferase [Acidobacteriota bacterium]